MLIAAAEKLAETAQSHATDDVLEDLVGRFLLVDVSSAVLFVVRAKHFHAVVFRKTGATKTFSISYIQGVFIRCVPYGRP